MTLDTLSDLTEVDPVAVARRWLLTRDRVTSMLGTPTAIGPYNEPPYPCIVLTDVPGDDRYLTHLIAPMLQVAVYGDPDGRQGKPLLRRVLYAALQELVLLPQTPTAPGEPVVAAVTSSGGGGWSPEPTGQPRYLATLQVWLHPPRP